MDEHFYAVVMAGGGGTRLWPLSRQQCPKQMLRLFSDRTMFQIAVDRVLPLMGPERTLVVTAADQVAPLAEQAPSLPACNFIIEPMGRGTAACIGLSAVHLLHRDPEAVMAVVAADHLMRREEAFRDSLRAARRLADQGHLVTLGIEPTYPSTGYGYIRRGRRLGTVDALDYYEMVGFREKPDLTTATRFLQEGLYAWNSGMFVWRADRLMEEIARWMPELSAVLDRLSEAVDTPAYADVLAEQWPPLERQTIDYGVMEKAENAVVIPVDLGWSDIGVWSSVMDWGTADAAGNVIEGDVIGLDTADSLVLARGGRLVVTIGLQDIVVVDTSDALLVARRDQAERVREIVAQLEAAGRSDKL